jgi:hypothetical protein
VSRVTEEDLRKIITEAVAETLPKVLDLEQFTALRDRLASDLARVV